METYHGRVLRNDPSNFEIQSDVTIMPVEDKIVADKRPESCEIVRLTGCNEWTRRVPSRHSKYGLGC